MRLTLRTLLAYRDRVLNANEIEDMHGRVQQSAMASNLIKRLESLSQRTNILAPPVEGKGLGGDANSIAEYLDDTLKGDKVPELERICLESDVQLAELAQCHSLLSAALSTSVEVPNNLRQRVVALSDETQRKLELARRQHESRGAIESSSAALAAHEAQDELRKTQSGNRGRFRLDEPHVDSSASDSKNGKTAKPQERQLVTAQAVTAPMMASGGDSIRPSGLDLEGSHLAHEVPEYLRGRSRDGWLGPVAIGGLLCLLCFLVWQSVGSWNSVRDMFTLAPKQAESNANKPDSPAVEASNAAVNSNSVATPTDATTAAQGVSTAVLPARPTDSTAKPTRTDPLIISSEGNSGVPGATENPATGVNQVAQWLPADASAMQSVLLVHAGNLPLHRWQPAESLPSGSQFFVPPANRPRLDIVGGPRWQVCGTTHALLTKPESGPAAEPQIDLRLGRAIVAGSNAGDALSILSPAGNIRLKLPSGSSAAVEVSYLPKTHGPATSRTAYPPTLAIIGLEGEFSLEINNQDIKLASGNGLSIVSGQPSTIGSAEPPLWVDSANDRAVDLQAAKDLSTKLVENGSIGDQLRELARDRRAENRALAAQTLALLGNWDWVTEPKSSLSDSRDRAFWTALLDGTRQILAAHPENAEELANQLKQLDPATAQWRMMLWLGLDEGQLQADSGKKIVASLEHEALIERILAINQLQRATGKDLGYRAAEPSRTIVGQWSRELATSKIQLLPVPKS